MNELEARRFLEQMMKDYPKQLFQPYEKGTWVENLVISMKQDMVGAWNEQEADRKCHTLKRDFEERKRSLKGV